MTSIADIGNRWKSSTPRLNRCPDGFRGEARAPVPNFDQLRRFDIGARKVLSHEEQRLATQAGGGVAETIAEIEAGRVTASPESEKCLTRLTPVTRSEGNHLNLEHLQKA